MLRYSELAWKQKPENSIHENSKPENSKPENSKPENRKSKTETTLKKKRWSRDKSIYFIIYYLLFRWKSKFHKQCDRI